MHNETPTPCKRRKAVAHALSEARREPYIIPAKRALLLAMLERGTATIDTARSAVELPADIDPKAFGAVPGHPTRTGIIRADRFTKSTHAESHAQPVQVWRLVNPSAALAWLAAHPDPMEAEKTETTGSAETAEGGDGYLFPMNAVGARHG